MDIKLVSEKHIYYVSYFDENDDLVEAIVSHYHDINTDSSKIDVEFISVAGEEIDDDKFHDIGKKISRTLGKYIEQGDIFK